MRKSLLCVVLVLALILSACGGDDKATTGFGLNGNQSAASDDGNGSTDEKNATANSSAKNDSNTDSASKSGEDASKSDASKDKGDTADSMTTGGTVTEVIDDENIYNIGGIGFRIPNGMKQKNVFVGPCIAFEGSKMGAVIYGWSYNLGKYEEQYAEALAEMGEDFEIRKSVNEYVTGAKEVEYEGGARYISESEFVGDDLVEVAGFKGRKISYKGMIDYDVYKDGPIKGKAVIIEDEIEIYNDSDDNVIQLIVLCRESEYDSVSKLVEDMLSGAIADCDKEQVGSLDERYLENGGFSYTIPKCYGDVYNFLYDGAYRVMYSDSMSLLEYYLGYYIERSLYLYYDNPAEAIVETMEEYKEYGIESGKYWEEDMEYLASDMNIDWINFYACNLYWTRTNFEEVLIPAVEEWLPIVISAGFQECDKASAERVSIDGMDGIKFRFKVKQNDEDYLLDIIIVNNNKDRHISIITSMVEADGENVDAFDTLVSSMKNVIK